MIFGIGLSRTGTAQLAVALETLGFRTIHHPCDKRTIEQLQQADFDLDVFETYEAAVDLPIAPYYEDFDRYFPRSKFIMTLREEKSWLRSVEQHWSRAPVSPVREFCRLIAYQTIVFDAHHYSHVCRRHVQNVLQHFCGEKKKQLLTLDIAGGDGWEKLCPFLQRPVPAVPFPPMDRSE